MESKSKKLLVVLLCIALAMTFSFTGSVFAEEETPASGSAAVVEGATATEQATSVTDASKTRGSEATEVSTENKEVAEGTGEVTSEEEAGETTNGDATASKTNTDGEKSDESLSENPNETASEGDAASAETLPKNWGNIATINGLKFGSRLNLDDSRKLNVSYRVQQNTSGAAKVDSSDLGKEVDPSHISEQYVRFNGEKYNSLAEFEANKVGTGELVTTWDNGHEERDGFTFYTRMTIKYVDDAGDPIPGFGSIDRDIEVKEGRFDLSNQIYKSISLTYKFPEVIEGKISGSAEDLTGHQNVTIQYKRCFNVAGWIIWDDNEDKAKLRPDSTTVHLFAGDKEIYSKDILAKDNQTYRYAWYFDFGLLPFYDNGTPIKYIISEEPVRNYTTRVEGFNIWNKYNPPAPYIPPVPTKTIRVNKVWVTDDGGTPAESVDVQILKNGEAYKVVTLSDANGWNYSEAVIDDGAKYTAQEVTSVDGFVSSVTEDGDTITITNDDVKKPDKPVKPDKPTKPDKPVKPTKPDKPAKPSKPAKPKNPAVSVPVERVKANVPKTGDENHMGLYGGMLVLAAAGAAVLLRLRRKSGK